MSEAQTETTAQPAPKWRPLPAIDRRVAGVLLEKAKTTPDAYPMTLNAIRTGCNQKNNRYPLMELELDDVQESLDRLRALGAVGEVHGSSRAAKYRHHLYEWLGVGKVEMAVMAELLLRGTQTEGELRGRASRMEPIADLAALRPVLNSLKAKGLIISLTPEGRGHVVTHALYEPREMEKVRREFEHVRVTDIDSLAAPADESAACEVPARMPTPQASQPAAAEPRTAPAIHSSAAAAPAQPASAAVLEAVAALNAQMVEVQAELARLRKDIDDLWAEFR
jgi:uncharacterized protein YceH (UPF0502 family)